MTPAGLIGMIELAAMMELAEMLAQPSELMIEMLAVIPEVSADLTGIIGLMVGMPIAAQWLAEMAETTELARVRQAELLHCTALAGRPAMVGLAALTGLVAEVAPAVLIESTEVLGILVALTAGMPIASPTALAELAEILEPVEPLESAALLAEPLGPVELAVLTAETPTELMVGLLAGLLAGLVGHSYSRR